MRDIRNEVKRFRGYLYTLARARETVGGAQFVEESRWVSQPEARAALAQLRKAVGQPAGAVVEALPHVVPFLPEYPEQWETDAFFIVGGLFGLHPTAHADKESLGYALGQVGHHESAEKRVAALLGCPKNRLAPFLRQAIGLAAGAGVPVNYGQLLLDLLRWDDPMRSVQLRWAGDYWRRETSGGDDEKSLGDSVQAVKG